MREEVIRKHQCSRKMREVKDKLGNEGASMKGGCGVRLREQPVDHCRQRNCSE